MLDAWVNRGDVLKLLFDLEAISDCVEQKRLIFEINRLKKHKNPQKPKKQRVINYLDDVMKSIKNYKHAVKYKGRVSYLEKYIETLNEADKEVFIKCFDSNTMYINIIPLENLKNIVKVSDRTISRWAKKGFIKPKENHSAHRHFVYVDLAEINK